MNAAGFSFSHPGFCPICENNVIFSADGPYFRSTLRCSGCQSAPRNRAMMYSISQFFPLWRDLSIHESSPGWDLVSQRLVKECKFYEASQYDTSVPFGSTVLAPNMPCRQYRSENLELQSYADETFDLVVTQDVFEHIFSPDRAIAEIARTLKPNGATIMTVPICMKDKPSRRRARLTDDVIEYILPAEYHGNPLGSEGSLVTIDWGFDIVSYMHKHSGLSFIMLRTDNIDLGIRAELNEVLIGFKRQPPEL